jgi:5-methyltetrahydropteroyltriglutamate--homocysteine methyltransferase
MIQTTTIGAYPKPGYVPITDWFTTDHRAGEVVDYTSAYAEELEAAGDDAEMLFRQATKEIIDDQIDAGIDIVTDGEVRRENYVHAQCRYLSGFDFKHLGQHRIRDTIETRLPTVSGPVGFDTSPLARDFEIAQSMSARPVKVTLPGPMTIIDTTVDAHYYDERALGADLAVALNAQIHDLVAAGCRHIQIDEPVMARKPTVALDYGIDQLGRCFDNVPATVTRTVHCCCGYPRRLDDTEYPKADRRTYIQLAPALDAAPIDQVSIEDAHRHNDLAALLPLFANTTVVLGVVAIAQSRVETVEEITARLRVACGYLPEDRLVAAPDCGLGYLGRDLAQKKLRALTTAAATLNG